jgi:hypothetical protein
VVGAFGALGFPSEGHGAVSTGDKPFGRTDSMNHRYCSGRGSLVVEFERTLELARVV